MITDLCPDEVLTVSSGAWVCGSTGDDRVIMAQDAKPQRGKRIAIVGGGISGIACMWGLRDTDCDVHLFESDSRLGGHADTNVFRGNGICAPVDTGFIAMNESAYRK